MPEPAVLPMPVADALAPPPTRFQRAAESLSEPVRQRLDDAFAFFPDQPEQVLALASEIYDEARAQGDEAATAWAQVLLGYARHQLSDHRTAAADFTEALVALDSLGDLAGRAAALDGLAGIYLSQGQYEEAVDAAQQSLAVTRALGLTENEAWTTHGLANLMLDLDDPAQALQLAEKAWALFDRLDRDAGRARALIIVGGARRRLSEPAAARQALTDALALARREGSQATEARALDDLGLVDVDAGAFERAAERFRASLQLREAVGNRQAQAGSLLHLGEALTAMGRPADAVEALTDGLALAKEVGAAPREADLHLALAGAYESAGDPTLALVHLRAHQDGRERVLSAQARSRVETVQMRAAVERAQRDAELERVRTAELGATNRELEATLDRLRLAQNRLVQAEKMASLGRLSAGLAHEIRNPLNFVLNFSEVAGGLATDIRDRLGQQSGTLDADARADLDALVDSTERVRHHARRAEGIVQSLVGHAGRAPGAARAPVVLADLLDAVVADALPDGSPVVVRRAFAADLPPVEGDAASLRQTADAIVANALRALAEHPPADASPTLTLTTRWAARATSPAVEIVVADNGPGIAPEHCGRVFEPFFTTRPPGEGTGLGLALAYDAVVAGHGGRLSVRSELGHGAAFTVRLPVASPADL